MSKGNESAFPGVAQQRYEDPVHGVIFPGQLGEFGSVGLTKREYFAAKILQGFVSADDHQHVAFNYGEDNYTMAKAAVRLADALIEELSKDAVK